MSGNESTLSVSILRRWRLLNNEVCSAPWPYLLHYSPLFCPAPIRASGREQRRTQVLSLGNWVSSYGDFIVASFLASEVQSESTNYIASALILRTLVPTIVWAMSHVPVYPISQVSTSVRSLLFHFKTSSRQPNTDFTALCVSMDVCWVVQPGRPGAYS